MYIMESEMKVAKWGNSLAVRIPREVAEALHIGEGDEIALTPGEGRILLVDKVLTREQALERLRALAKPLPPGWKFDREEANGR
jgi:antitoxin MazE